MATQKWRKAHIKEMRAYRRAWYRRNKKHAKAQSSLRRTEIKRWVMGYKRGQSCSRCPESHPACLDFHHPGVSDKEDSVHNLVWRCVSLERIKREIAKCVVLCANCHRKLHYESRPVG